MVLYYWPVRTIGGVRFNGSCGDYSEMQLECHLAPWFRHRIVNRPVPSPNPTLLTLAGPPYRATEANMKLLLVEDNERVAQFVKKGLTESGHTVDHAATGREGIFLAASEPYDAIIMDRMLPGGIDGLGIIEALRKAGNVTPILILSALGEVDERIRGLKAGGDDYLVKPFEFAELLARVMALLRRSQTRHAQTMLVAGDLRMDLLTHKVTCGDRVVSLQPREFKLLAYLMRHADQVVTRTMLLENVWEYHFQPQTNVIDVHISKLRQKIDFGSDRQRLQTIRNAGYMLTSNA